MTSASSSSSSAIVHGQGRAAGRDDEAEALGEERAAALKARGMVHAVLLHGVMYAKQADYGSTLAFVVSEAGATGEPAQMGAPMQLAPPSQMVAPSQMAPPMAAGPVRGGKGRKGKGVSDINEGKK